MTNQIFTVENSLLLVVDVQGNLAYRMHDKDRLFHNLQGLIRAATILNIPILCTEQVPHKIGKTVPEIDALLPGITKIEKHSFSCWLEPGFSKAVKKTGRKQIIMCGIEAHVCVFQTAADLLSEGFQVQVVANAVSSRAAENKEMALERIRQCGGIISSLEMTVTELMRDSRHEKFKEVLSLIK